MMNTTGSMSIDTVFPCIGRPSDTETADFQKSISKQWDTVALPARKSKALLPARPQAGFMRIIEENMFFCA
jgi:hypothetical protein